MHTMMMRWALVLVAFMAGGGQTSKINEFNNINVVDRVQTIRSPGSLEISQFDLLGVQEQVPMVPQSEGDISMLDMEIRGHNPLEFADFEPISTEVMQYTDIKIKSFFIGSVVRKRLIVVATPDIIKIIDIMSRKISRMVLTPYSVVSVLDKQLCSKQNFSCRFHPSTLEILTVSSKTYIAIEVYSTNSDKSWLGLSELCSSIDGSIIGNWVIPTDNMYYQFTHVGLPIKCESMRLIMFYGVINVNIIRYCELPEGTTKGNIIETYIFNGSQIKYMNKHESFQANNTKTDFYLLKIYRMSNFLVFFDMHRTVFAYCTKLEYMIRYSEGKKNQVVQTMILSNDQNYPAECNFMSSGHYGCVSELPSLNREYYFVAKEYYVHEGILSVGVHTYFSHKLEGDTRLETRGILYKDYVIVQTNQSFIIMNHKKTNHTSMLNFTNKTFIFIYDFFQEENLQSRHNGYILAAFGNPNNFHDTLKLGLMTVSLPYFEIETHVNMQNMSCDRYINDCGELFVTFKSALTDTVLVKKFYLIGNGFTSVLKMTTGKGTSIVARSEKQKINLLNEYLGFIIRPKLSPYFQWYETLNSSMVAGNNGLSTGEYLDYYETSVQTYDNLAISHLFSVIKYNENNTISLFILYTKPLNKNKNTLMLARISPDFDIQTRNQTLPGSYFNDLNLNNYICDYGYPPERSVYLLLDLSYWSTKTLDILAYTLNSRHLYMITIQYANGKINDTVKQSTYDYHQALSDFEFFKEVKAFRRDGKTQLVVITSEKLTILSTKIERKGITISIISNISTGQMPGRILDLMVEGEYLLVLSTSLVTSLELKYHLYFYKILSGMSSLQIIGVIEVETIDNMFVYYSRSLRKLIIAYYNKWIFEEYYFGEGIMIGNPDKVSRVKPVSTLYMKKSKFVANYFSRLAHIKKHYNENTINMLPESNIISVQGILKDEVRRMHLSFKLHKNEYLCLVKVVPTPIDEQNYTSPYVIGDEDPDLISFVTISQKEQLNKVTLYNVFHKGVFELDYKETFQDGDKEKSSVSLQFEDLNRRQYGDILNVIRTHKFSLLPLTKNYTYSQSKLFRPEELGMGARVSFTCNKEENTQVMFGRSKYTFSCGSKEVYEVEEPMKLESYLMVESATLLEVNDLYEVDYKETGLKYLFAVLCGSKLYFFKSVDSSLEFIAILHLGKSQDEFGECRKISRIIRHSKSDSDLQIILLCSPGISYYEFETRLDISILSNAYHFGSVFSYLALPTNQWQLKERVWQSMVEDADYQMVGDSILISRNEIEMRSIGKRHIMEIYIKDNSIMVPSYVLQATSIQDSYLECDLFDILVTGQKGEFNSDQLELGVLEKLTPEKSANESSNIPFYMSSFYVLQLRHNKRTGDIGIKRYKYSYDWISEVMISENAGSIVGEGRDNNILLYGEMYLQEEGSTTRLYYFLIYEDYILEYEIPNYQNLTQEASNPVLLKRYNYLGLCSEDASFKLIATKQYLRVNCIPKDLETGTNNLLIFKRSSHIYSEQLDKEGRPIYHNTSHILALTSGYSRSNLQNIVFDSKDGKTRLLQMCKTHLVKQLVLNEGYLLKLKTTSMKLLQPKLNIHVYNSFESIEDTFQFKLSRLDLYYEVSSRMDIIFPLSILILGYLLLFFYTVYRLRVFAAIAYFRNLFTKVANFFRRLSQKRQVSVQNRDSSIKSNQRLDRLSESVLNDINY